MVKSLRRLKIGMFGPPNLMRTLYRSFGTSITNTISAEIGDSPVKNWIGIGMYDFPYDKSKNISSININKYKTRDYGCFGCPVQCGALLKVRELKIDEMHIPEYETCCAFGTLLLNDNLFSIFEINDLCNRAGIDTISAGATIPFAIECFEKGILTLKDTNGLELRWGDSYAICELVKMMINREGIGDILADGSYIAAKRIGNNSIDFTNTVLGSEVAMHDPKYIKSLAFTYTYDPTPGRHTAASIDFSDIAPIDRFETAVKFPKKRRANLLNKVKSQVINTGFHQILSCSGLCMFATYFGEYPFINLINTLTSWDFDVDELIKIGIRIQTLRHSFNLREGVNVINNELPRRVFGDPPFEKGPLKGKKAESKQFYKDYCNEIGWNPKTAIPLENTLKYLDLQFLIKDLY
ncbi:MAG: aldehyde ferredoxin oxidoreductase C-terminal domain-containing protein [Candidatus Thorarchaeota archaeon]